jgi:hypothetical protein
MVVGSCPGVGKSTITTFLADELAAHGVPTRCLLEDTLSHLRVLAPIREGFQKENSDKIDILLTVAKALAEEFVRLPEVHLIDAFLPGYHFLFGLYPIASISEYSARLYTSLARLHPMIIHLKGDVSSAFRRAVEERGQEWFDEFLERINWHFRAARYERVSLPLDNKRDVFAYFDEMDQLLQAMVGEWRGRHTVIDTREQTLDKVKMMLTDLIWADDLWVKGRWDYGAVSKANQGADP